MPDHPDVEHRDVPGADLRELHNESDHNWSKLEWQTIVLH
jgi:hypothetical protein